MASGLAVCGLAGLLLVLPGPERSRTRGSRWCLVGSVGFVGGSQPGEKINRTWDITLRVGLVLGMWRWWGWREVCPEWGLVRSLGSAEGGPSSGVSVGQSEVLCHTACGQTGAPPWR